MIKRTLLPLFIIASLAVTQAFGIAYRQYMANSQAQSTQCRLERYLFPIYKMPDNTYFIPIRTEAENLKLEIVEAPLGDQKNLNSVWQLYKKTLDDQDTKNFNSQETQKNFELLANSELVDFAVFLHCEWSKWYQDKESLWMMPYLLLNETLVIQTQDAKPYFNSFKRKTGNLRNFGVVFQVPHAKAIAFEEAFVKTYEQDREVKNAATEKAKKAAEKAAKGEL